LILEYLPVSGFQRRCQKDEKDCFYGADDEYAEPKERYRDNENILFSRPNFYGEIADNIGICDVVRLRESVHHVDTENAAVPVFFLFQLDNFKARFQNIGFVAGLRCFARIKYRNWGWEGNKTVKQT